MGLSWLRQRDLVLVLVLVITVTSSAIELTGDNVCHRVENYTVSLRESYTEPVVVNTFAWCLQIPPRCPRSRVEMRERWRIKTETKQRKVMECCEGYIIKMNEEKFAMIENSKIGKCEPHCDMCEYGRCIAPNTCKCEPGHRGNGCAYECPSGTWGEKCSRACDCQSVEICNPIDGKCHCPPGWRGFGCNEKCPAGLWGVDCRLSCACNYENYGNNKSHLSLTTRELTSVCHHETGSCINLQQTIVPFVPEIMTSDRSDRKETIETSNFRSIDILVPPLSTKSSFDIEPLETLTLSTDYDISYVNGNSADETNDDRHNDRVADETQEFATRSSRPIEAKIDYDQPAVTSTSTERDSSETSMNRSMLEIGKIETSTITPRIDAKLTRVKKPSTPGPIVDVVHVSGNGLADRDGPMIMTSLGADYVQPAVTSTSTERDSSETSMNPSMLEIGKIETSIITPRIDTNKYDNYDVHQRIERIDSKVPGVKKPSTPGPIVAVVHVSGNGSPDHDGPMIMTSLGADKIPTHAVPMPLDIAALIVIGSIISLGLTTLAVLTILHIRSKLFETIRLSIYDAAEKRDASNDTIRRGGGEKMNPDRISAMGCNNSIMACEYETPRCMIPEHRTLTRPRPASNVEVPKKPESSYSNDYPNIRLFSNLQELLEAHYDRPPSTFRHAVLDVDGEHVYDEIPLQSSTTFTTTKIDS